MEETYLSRHTDANLSREIKIWCLYSESLTIFSSTVRKQVYTTDVDRLVRSLLDKAVANRPTAAALVRDPVIKKSACTFRTVGGRAATPWQVAKPCEV